MSGAARITPNTKFSLFSTDTDQAGPSRILSNRPAGSTSVVCDSNSSASVVSDSNSLAHSSLAEKKKKQYDKWPQEEKRVLVNVWVRSLL